MASSNADGLATQGTTMPYNVYKGNTTNEVIANDWAAKSTTTSNAVYKGNLYSDTTASVVANNGSAYDGNDYPDTIQEEDFYEGDEENTYEGNTYQGNIYRGNAYTNTTTRSTTDNLSSTYERTTYQRNNHPSTTNSSIISSNPTAITYQSQQNNFPLTPSITTNIQTTVLTPLQQWQQSYHRHEYLAYRLEQPTQFASSTSQVRRPRHRSQTRH